MGLRRGGVDGSRREREQARAADLRLVADAVDVDSHHLLAVVGEQGRRHVLRVDLVQQRRVRPRRHGLGRARRLARGEAQPGGEGGTAAAGERVHRGRAVHPPRMRGGHGRLQRRRVTEEAEQQGPQHGRRVSPPTQSSLVRKGGKLSMYGEAFPFWISPAAPPRSALPTLTPTLTLTLTRRGAVRGHHALRLDRAGWTST